MDPQQTDRRARSMQAPDAVIGPLARVRRWLGRDLPPRTLELRFAPTPQRRQGRRPPLTPEAAHEALGRHSTTPEAYLTELLSIAAGTNPWPLSPKQRMALLESLTGWLYVASFAAPARLFACRPPPTPAASGDVTAAAVTEDDLMDEPLTCLLTHHPQQGWGIITPPAEGLWQQSLVCLRMGRRYSRARLGDAQDVTDELYRFQVSSAGLPDKPPHYPQVTARASIQAATDAAG
ncbi:hypothetical protein [Thiohalocapsa halophila]